MKEGKKRKAAAAVENPPSPKRVKAKEPAEKRVAKPKPRRSLSPL